MSDEQLRTRITLLMQDVGWGIEGSYYVDEDAVVRILNEHDAALESQNQALQEERDLLQSRLSGQTKLTGMLQERAERAEALLRRIMDEGLYEDATHALIEVYFATRPTQETDPE